MQYSQITFVEIAFNDGHARPQRLKQISLFVQACICLTEIFT